MRYIFSKTVAIIVIAILVVSTVIAVHARLNEPKDTEWNYNHFKQIDTRRHDFTFAVFGDNKNSIKTFGQLITHVNSDNPLFAFDDGDLVFDGEMEKFQFFLGQARQFTVPLLTAIGNHETYSDGRVNYFRIFGAFYYSFTIGPNYFIVLDDADEHNIDDWQMRWLTSELQKSQSYLHRFIFLHVPLHDPRRTALGGEHALKDEAGARRLNAMFDRSNVTMIFASHIHEYDRGMWGKTPFIVTGGAGAELVGTDPAHAFYHYVRVHVTDTGVSYDVVRLDSPGPSWLARLLHDAWIYAYAYLAINYVEIVIVFAVLYLLLFVLYRLEKKEKWFERWRLRRAKTEK